MWRESTAYYTPGAHVRIPQKSAVRRFSVYAVGLGGTQGLFLYDDLNLARLLFAELWQDDLEHAVLVLCCNLCFIHGIR